MQRAARPVFPASFTICLADSSFPYYSTACHVSVVPSRVYTRLIAHTRPANMGCVANAAHAARIHPMRELHFLLDGDGVLWRGGETLPGAPEFVRFLRGRGHGASLVSNNSSRRRESVAARLAERGIEIGAADVFHTNYLAGRYMSEHHAGDDIFVLGQDGLTQELQSWSLSVHTPEDLLPPGVLADPGLGIGPFVADKLNVNPTVVLVGIDTSVNWASIVLACRLIEDGARLIATNRDFSFPAAGRYLLPGNGAVVAVLEGVTGAPVTTLGKPETHLVELIEREKGVPRDSMVVIGDRLETDIELAHNAGVRSVLVLTGITPEPLAHWPPKQKPTFIVRDLLELMARFDELFARH